MIATFESAQEFLHARQQASSAEETQLVQKVTEIISKVHDEGESALRYFTQKFDGVEIENFRVPSSEIRDARNNLSGEIEELLLAAIENVRTYHQKQLPTSWLEKTADDTLLGMQFRPIDRVGIYVPGGKAGYPSTLIMTVVPAQVAGVKQLALVSPPTKGQGIDMYVLATAGLLGVDEVYIVGGAQAIAALAYGTESIAPVDKIVGPGNAYVNEAKRQVFGVCGIDQLAGPTELVILADHQARTDYIVRDLFAQAEHDIDTKTVLITPSGELAEEVATKAEKLVVTCERADILHQAVSKYGAIVLVKDLEEGIKLVNDLAPEHLQILTTQPRKIMHKINHAGTICLGEWTPAVVGDYCAGPNHVLPTARNARFSSPLNVMNFMKFSSVIEYSKAKFMQTASAIAKLADMEGLPNHKEAILTRDE